MSKFDIQPFLTPEINLKAAGVLAHLAGAEGKSAAPLSWAEVMKVLVLLTATMIDGEPAIASRKDMRRVIEEFGSDALTLASSFRQMTNATGQSHLQRLGATSVN